MPFYTRRGDKGKTELIGGSRVPKSDLIIEILGTIDETDAAIGVARSQCQVKEICEILYKVQKDLYLLMADIASLCEAPAEQRNQIGENHILWLEDRIDLQEKSYSLPDGFIIPGDCYSAALLDTARTISRRAERRMVAYAQEKEIHNPYILQFLNRLSSLCYALELRELSYFRKNED